MLELAVGLWVAGCSIQCPAAPFRSQNWQAGRTALGSVLARMEGSEAMATLRHLDSFHAEGIMRSAWHVLQACRVVLP